MSRWHTMAQVSTASKDSDALSKDLKTHGFRFVGSTTVSAFMQAVGMVHDRLLECSYRRVVTR